MFRTICIAAAVVTFGLPVWAAECEGWNTEEFFKAVSPDDAASCLRTGSDAMARSEDGTTPLHYAAAYSNDNPAVLEVLIAAGADLNTRTEDGNTPLHYAADSNDDSAVLEVLIAAGADVNARNEGGELPFDFAEGNYAIKGSKVYWVLNDARFK